MIPRSLRAILRGRSCLPTSSGIRNAGPTHAQASPYFSVARYAAIGCALAASCTPKHGMRLPGTVLRGSSMYVASFAFHRPIHSACAARHCRGGAVPPYPRRTAAARDHRDRIARRVMGWTA